MTLSYLDDDYEKMYGLYYGEKGEKVLLDGIYSQEDLLRIIKIMEKKNKEHE